MEYIDSRGRCLPASPFKYPIYPHSLFLITNKQLKSVSHYISSPNTARINMFFNMIPFWSLTILACGSLIHTVSGPGYDSPYGGPPAEYFASSKSSLVSSLKHAFSKVSEVPSLATYPVNREENNSDNSTIYSDWASFDEGSALVWIADMDVDCDGINSECKGSTASQTQTNWGALSAYEVPYIVIPDRFLSANKEMLPGKNVAAVICNGKMLYGILGDTNGHDPQITGEASWLMARTCFANDDLSGAKGHTTVDVIYILFTGEHAVLPDSAMNEHYITDFSTLRRIGDNLVDALISNFAPSTGSTTTLTSAATPTWTWGTTPTRTKPPTQTMGPTSFATGLCVDYARSILRMRMYLAAYFSFTCAGRYLF
ncbi:fungal chitosanase of glycosyl hydrolase group 75-domain-containing protein [Aspergillus floccosus]